MSAARWAAAVIVAVTVGMNVGTLWVVFATDFLSNFAGLGFTDIDFTILKITIVVHYVILTMSYVSIGLLLVGRTGAGRIAAVLLAGGSLLAATPFGYGLGGELVFTAPQNPLANAVFMFGPVAYGPAYALILPGLAIVFPTGHLPSRRWRVPVGLVAGAMVAGTIGQLVRPGPIAGNPSSHNPFGIDALPAGLGPAADMLQAAALLGLMVFGVAAVLVRHRHGDVTTRKQLRWFIAAVLLAALPLLLSIIPGTGGPHWALIASVGLVLVPVSVGIAVTRHRLYEIDRLISRTIGWAIVTGVLVAVFAAMVVGLQAALASITQGQTLAVAASTLAAFALFQPVRRRVQAIVDRRFDRARYDGEQTAAAFAERLRNQIDLQGLEADVAHTVGVALRPTSTGIWIRRPGGETPR